MGVPGLRCPLLLLVGLIAAAVIWALVILITIVTAQAYDISTLRADARSFTCLYPLGGGVVPPGGAFPQHQLQGVLFTADGTPLYRPEGTMVPERQQHCLVRLQAYLQHQYDQDVEAAVAMARAFFGAYVVPPNASHIVVLDIDETALSNEMPRIGQAWDDWDWGLRPGQQVTGVDIMSMAPALKPVLALYKELYSKGFSVTFITGRTESQGGREATAANLEHAGYGRQCSQEQLAGGGRREGGEPCYVALGMRAEGARRLASVYKPDQRRQLQERGFVLVASFGDQFSDLDGTNTALASFKLPNPWYYII